MNILVEDSERRNEGNLFWPILNHQFHFVNKTKQKENENFPTNIYKTGKG